MSGLCETCIAPGHCCKRLPLSGVFSEPMSRERVEHLLLSPKYHSQLRGLFHPGAQDPDGRWRFWCTALQEDGRCGIYEDRPKLCRGYPPGHDALCVHYWAPPLDEGGTGGTSPEPIEGTEKPADS